MEDELNLFKSLLIKSERFLVPCGIWPSLNNGFITLFNIIVLFVYSILVIAKNIKSPDRESVENAFTLANGGLIAVTYFVTVIFKKDEFLQFYAIIKSDGKILTKNHEKEMTIAVGKEYKRILTVFSYLMPCAILVRFIQPPIEYLFIQLFREDKTFNLPPSMGIPDEILGEIPTYIIESFVRAMMLVSVVGISFLFILSTLFICNKFNILAKDFELMSKVDDEEINKIIGDHQELLSMAKQLNELFGFFFFANCFFSFVNLTIMMFSLIASNVRVQNFLIEVPFVSAGLSQLFFVLYFGDRLIDATYQIGNAAYQSEWYNNSLSNQKKIGLVIFRAIMKPQTLNVGNNFLVASMLLFSQICQKSYGAFNILRQQALKN